jgi:hypothetical protein
MIVPASAPSILIFEINKKFLLFKILDRKFTKQLKIEVTRLYGDENFHQDEDNVQNLSTEFDRDEIFHSEENGSSTEEVETEIENLYHKSSATPLSRMKLKLTNDLIYQYFSPIINSFEISREINYLFEYIFIDRNKYIIRFYLHKNCLVLLIYDMNHQNFYQNSLNVASKFGSCELTRQIYIDFYTNWYNKSIISLLKFKFGICADEKCFNNQSLNNNRKEIHNLFLKWSELFQNDQSYFVEAIDQFVLNDDIKSKCKYFLDELIGFLYNVESIFNEFEFMDDKFKKDKHLDEKTETSDENFDSNLRHLKNLEITEEFEQFFSDPTQINQFILTYNNKLLFKYRKVGNKKTKVQDQNEQQLFIDSSSLYMLLLEAAEFLNYSPVNILEDMNEDEDDDGSLSENDSIFDDTNLDSGDLTPKSKSFESLNEDVTLPPTNLDSSQNKINFDLREDQDDEANFEFKKSFQKYNF